ncbi:ATP-binding mismatch repair protein [Tilletia horrida]|nr:ATP-binding mismatch repair protein [Tilletia horrida]
MNSGEAGSSRIRALDRADVHRITSAQVVLDLQTAVKEVVENALDAGATNIEVRFKDYGAESFEVIDNGSGIDPKDYDAIALKHHTSKLSSFTDLEAVHTFGFRGEALSSLCALASVTMHTATETEAPVGTVLTFEKSGKVTPGARKQPRQRGTTVIVRDLFQGFPVRRREFEKNLKREYAKAQGILQSYALIQKGVRWTVYNIPKAGGRKTMQMSMSANSTPSFLLSNVTDLFGAKVAATLDSFQLKLDVDLASTSRLRKGNERKSRTRNGAQQSSSNDRENDDEEDSEGDTDGQSVEVVGAMSKLLPTCGRTSADRQFIYINGRPWDTTKFVRIFNEVYRSNNIDRYPMVIANFILPPASYDLNITPDKRTIFLHFESALQDALRTALETLVSRYHGVFSVNSSTQTARTHQSQIPEAWSARASGSTALEDDAEEDEDVETSGDGTNGDEGVEAIDKSAIGLSQAEDNASDEDHDGHTTDDHDAEDVPGQAADDDMASAAAKTPHEHESGSDGEPDYPTPPGKRQRRLAQERDGREGRNSPKTSLHVGTRSPKPLGVVEVQPRQGTPFTRRDTTSPSSSPVQPRPEGAAPEQQSGARNDEEDGEDEDEVTFVQHTQVATLAPAATLRPPTLPGSEATTLPLDLRWLQQRAINSSPDHRSQDDTATTQAQDLTRAGVGKDATEAEEQLQRVICKSDFAQMQVVGQFNLGFIIARRRTRTGAADNSNEGSKGVEAEPSEDGAAGWMDDLFIVDQHASDEKYNFERLQADTVIQSQKLIQPRRLELPVSDELVAIEHLTTLKKNGFELEVDEEAQAGARLKLLAQPLSKGISFGPKDLAELLHLLRNLTPGSAQAQTMRCSKARAMFASRACRSSVMVGRPLNARQMRTILTHMGTIDQPWPKQNCPHGRPTMRHLVTLSDTVRDANGRQEEAGRTVNWAALQ